MAGRSSKSTHSVFESRRCLLVPGDFVIGGFLYGGSPDHSELGLTDLLYQSRYRKAQCSPFSSEKIEMEYELKSPVTSSHS